MNASLTDAAAWKSAVAQFNEQFIPIEKEVVIYLKERLLPADNDPIKAKPIQILLSIQYFSF